MKVTKFFASKSSLLAVGLLSASAGLMALPASAETVTVNLTDKTNTNTADYPTVSVTLDDTSNPGKITATVNVVSGKTGYTGDLRGVYFNLPGVSGLAITPIAGGPLSHISTNGDFSAFGNSAGLEGTKLDFNAGVEVGKQGIAKGDDYQSTKFTISGTGLTLSAFSSTTIGARLMSVGIGKNRDLSSKTAGTAPVIVAATPPSSPSAPAAPAPAAEAPVAPTAPAPVAETPTAPTAPAPVAETPVAPTAPAPVAETPTAPTAPAPVAETPAAPTAPAPVAETPAAPVVPGEPSGTPAPSNPGPGGEAEQVPEPATMAGSALGLAALMKWRKNRKASKNN
ncbi:PEP-CTERM sorting domain-containing protein [Microcoleus sp. FACHB-672]|uniref:PEP-CTERM sorting domain-containing protein n=1 Tax=Microcoleus sp. FACHB-672 TaxID=2692825 RepID=UPI001689AF12|nr:PEP-CTERM sorting domain-containing protein [Microcoleus sp. FACHB-672]MBD2039156.1 PEP-CTERM sorting domain-containing protein [Microcoleus sp. FACHB-672]